MPLLALPFPVIDPVLIEIGPLAIRWYALAYIAGFLFGWWLAKRLLATDRLWAGGKAPMPPAAIDDAIVWAALCGILGGRLAFVLIYNLDYYIAHPAAIIAVWEGGMAFHGGLLGTIVAIWLFCRRRGYSFYTIADLAAITVPIGLGLGRLGNFINGELYGRPTDVPWCMVFPGGGPECRHPSQLY